MTRAYCPSCAEPDCEGASDEGASCDAYVIRVKSYANVIVPPSVTIRLRITHSEWKRNRRRRMRARLKNGGRPWV